MLLIGARVVPIEFCARSRDACVGFLFFFIAFVKKFRNGFIMNIFFELFLYI